MRAANQYMQAIEGLGISTGYGFYSNFIGESIHFPNVKKWLFITALKQFRCKVQRIPFSFNELKELELEFELDDLNYTAVTFYKLLSENPSIERLTITYHENQTNNIDSS